MQTTGTNCLAKKRYETIMDWKEGLEPQTLQRQILSPSAKIHLQFQLRSALTVRLVCRRLLLPRSRHSFAVSRKTPVRCTYHSLRPTPEEIRAEWKLQGSELMWLEPTHGSPVVSVWRIQSDVKAGFPTEFTMAQSACAAFSR